MTICDADMSKIHFAALAPGFAHNASPCLCLMSEFEAPSLVEPQPPAPPPPRAGRKPVRQPSTNSSVPSPLANTSWDSSPYRVAMISGVALIGSAIGLLLLFYGLRTWQNVRALAKGAQGSCITAR